MAEKNARVRPRPLAEDPSMHIRAFRRVALLALAAAPATAALITLPNAAGSGAFPSTGTGGITWSASTPTDPQRDVGEPEVHIDQAGNIYTCGPSGFSNMADYAQVSTDGGDSFHLLGQAPRGQLSLGEGGGDCGLSSAPYKNAQGKYNFAYTGLGPLTNFSTATSSDTGHTFLASPVSESPVGVDRQWVVFTDANTALFNYNQLPLGYQVQKSTNGGLTYGPAMATGDSGGRIGPMRAILPADHLAAHTTVYFPAYKSSTIRLDISFDGGDHWQYCDVIDAEASPGGGFVLADHDTEGNVYIVWAQHGSDHDTFMTVVPHSHLKDCKKGEVIGTDRMYRVNRDKVDTTVMPWIVAGKPGRVAVAFFGTETNGNPDSGSLKASWYPYVSMSLNALSPNPKWAQSRVTSHPFHYNSICLNGTNCDVPDTKGKTADRSLADYFAIDLSPTTGRLHIVYGSAAKMPTDDAGHLSTATVVTQETGPSLLGGTLKARRPRVRNETADQQTDALAPYSALFATPSTANQAAMDVQRVDVSPEIDLNSGAKVKNGGVTVTIKVRDLSDSALQNALVGTKSQSLVYLFRFLNGYQPAGATLAWSPAAKFTFGFDDFTTRATESGQADPTAQKILVWPQAKSIKGRVFQDQGLIQFSIPRSYLRTQSGPTGPGQTPKVVGAGAGSMLYDATVWSLANAFTPVQKDQSYLYPVDQTASMDVVVGKGRPAKPGVAFR